MDKTDMIKLIEAYSSIEKLNKDIERITGGYSISSNENNKYSKIYNICEVIENNSKYADKDDDESFNEFIKILNGIGLSAEEKYEMLI